MINIFSAANVRLLYKKQGRIAKKIAAKFIIFDADSSSAM